VARVAAVQPDVLLVEASVARAAQEELLARGISLVQHCKRELLERLERHTGAKVGGGTQVECVCVGGGGGGRRSNVWVGGVGRGGGRLH
jgi:hypothetical protein